MSWEVYDKFYNAHWLLTGFSCRSFVQNLPDLGGGSFITEFVGVMDQNVNAMIFQPDQYEASATYLSDRLINDLKWRRTYYTDFYTVAPDYFTATERFRRLDFSGMSEDQMVSQFAPILDLQQQVRLLGTLLNGLIIDGRGHLSTKLRDSLHKSISSHENFDEIWSLLTQVTKPSYTQNKEQAFYKLAADHSAKDREHHLHQLHQQYCWLTYMYQGPAASFEQFKHEFEEMLVHPVNGAAQLAQTKRAQDRLMDRLHLGVAERQIVQLAQEVIWQKGYRKDIEYHGFWCYEPFFCELAKRKQTDDWQACLFLLPWEVAGFIRDSKPTVSELQARRAYSCLVVKTDSVDLLVGPKARALVASLRLDNGASDATETNGQCAYAGQVIGRTKLIFTPADMGKMAPGDIIISQATSPDLLPAMKQAGAIVTNLGGLICHAAITARELHIPCIVGTRNATEIFKDGDLIEVNATVGTAKKLS